MSVQRGKFDPVDLHAEVTRIPRARSKKAKMRKLREEAAGRLIASATLLFCTSVIAYLLWDCFRVAHPIQPVALGIALFYNAYSLGAYMTHRRIKED